MEYKTQPPYEEVAISNGKGKDSMSITLTRNEIVEELEGECQRRLQISAAELFRLYREGRLSDPGAVADLLILADLLPEDDELFGSV